MEEASRERKKGREKGEINLQMAGKTKGNGGKMDKKEGSDGWRSISRKFVRKCWPGEMESGVVCLFWLGGSPLQAPSLGTGIEG